MGVCAVISMMNPQNFDFNTLKDGIALIDDKLPELDPEENDQAMLDASLKWITKWGVGFTVVMIFIWPLLSLPAGCGDGTCGVFSEGYFPLLVSIALAWVSSRRSSSLSCRCTNPEKFSVASSRVSSPVPRRATLRKYFIAFTTTSSCTQTTEVSMRARDF